MSSKKPQDLTRQLQHILTNAAASSRSASIHRDIPAPTMAELIYQREMTELRIARSRRDSMKAASRALNAALIDELPKPAPVLKCAVHSGDCDGVTVANEHLTLEARRGRGFKEPYPMITSNGRSMVDWHALLKEETGQ